MIDSGRYFGHQCRDAMPREREGIAGALEPHAAQSVMPLIRKGAHSPVT